MATRYEARQSVEMPGVWLVDGDYSAIVIRAMTEAEAKITAWALNAVAEGHRLGRSPRQDEFTGFSDGVATYNYIDYDGPTEGVAP